MRIAIFSVTPYQLLLAIHLSSTILKECSVDLYILNHFDKTDKIANKLDEDTNIFNKIKYVDGKGFLEKVHTGTKLEINTKIIMSYHRYIELAKYYFEFENDTYDEVYFSWPDTIVKIAIKYLCSINPRLKINQLEDGFNSYSDEFRKKTWKDKIRDIFSNNLKLESRFNHLYLFKPELYSGDLPKSNIKRIPSISTENRQKLNLFNNVFGYSEEHSITEKVILLDHLNTKLDTDEWKEIIDLIDERFDTEFIVKMHPGSESDKYGDDIKIFSNQAVPWEIIALNNKINSKVLISFFTNAQISNKTLFDAEPYLIYLYDMVELKQYFKLNDDFVNLSKQVTNLYSDTSRVFIPKNMQEFSNILEKLKNIV